MEPSCKRSGPTLETLKNHWFSLFFGDLADLGSVLEASWRRLGSCVGAAAATDAAFDATEAVSKLLRRALGSIFSCLEALLERLMQF